MIEVRNLSKTYPGGVEAVRRIDFDVGAGEVFGLLGPNGAGKSTTVGMLTTTIVPTDGTARLGGFDVATEPLRARSISSVVFQDAVVDRVLTGRQHLDLHARLWGVDAAAAPARIDELADALGLATLLERPLASYSGGERVRRPAITSSSSWRILGSSPTVGSSRKSTWGSDTRARAISSRRRAAR